ncbi:hypothetical protein [Bacillus subtilis]|uniref:hypothetical protein n=1 Tax=Bacillus subtilis TaxID=1423 RepID=UPI002DBB27D5|nr:hypothetical protein [Bacillus subtilis]MEC1878369.1 hypothetical protein [Bacillus subtilis]MEC1936636.1 hypothetical protein [Bacillus subtilis]
MMKIVKLKDRYVKSYSVTNQKVVLTSEIKKAHVFGKSFTIDFISPEGLAEAIGGEVIESPKVWTVIDESEADL